MTGTHRPTTWREAIERLSEFPESPAHFESLSECFPDRSLLWLIDYDEFDRHFKKHWIHSWICTDTQVGIAVLTLDGQPVAISQQPARKSDEEILFLSDEIAIKVRTVLEELCERIPSVRILAKLDEKIDERWFERT